MTQETTNQDPRIVAAIRQAIDLHTQGQTEVAIQHLSSLLAEYPTAANLYGYIAAFLSRSGRFDEAIEPARQATLLAPESENASITLSQALWRTGQRDDAFEEMKRFIRVRPSKVYSEMIKEWKRCEAEEQGQADAESDR